MLLWVQVSVGRLGIITQLTLKIVPQRSVRQVEQDMTASNFADQVKQVQDAYLQAKQTGSPSAIWTALHSLNETQVLFFIACLLHYLHGPNPHLLHPLGLPLLDRVSVLPTSSLKVFSGSQAP